MSFTLWVRYSNNQPVSLEFETGNVDKLKDVVKHKLTKLRILDNDNIILRKHEGTVDLEPDAIVDESFGNTAKTPLQVSITGSLCVGQHERGAHNLFDNCHVCTVYSKLTLSSI